MKVTDQIDDFARFAKQQLAESADRSIDELYDEWRAQALREEDALAVKASLRDLENGERGQPLEEFLREFDAEQGHGQQ